MNIAVILPEDAMPLTHFLRDELLHDHMTLFWHTKLAHSKTEIYEMMQRVN